MTGTKNRPPGRARRRGKPAVVARLDRVAQTFKAAAGVMRELTGLLLWSTAPLATVALVAHAVLTGSLHELVEVLIALRSG